MSAPATALCKASVLNPLASALCSEKAIKHCCTEHRAATVALDRNDRLRVVDGNPAALFHYDKFDKKGGGSYYHLGAFGTGEQAAHVPVRFFPFRGEMHLALFPEPLDAERASLAEPRLLPAPTAEPIEFVYCASGWCGDWCPRAMFSKFPRFRTCDSCRERRKKVGAEKRRSVAAVAPTMAAKPARARAPRSSKRKALTVRVASSPTASLKAPKTAPAMLALPAELPSSGASSAASRIALDPAFHVLDDFEALGGVDLALAEPMDPLRTLAVLPGVVAAAAAPPLPPRLFGATPQPRWPAFSASRRWPTHEELLAWPPAMPAAAALSPELLDEVDGFLSNDSHSAEESPSARSPALMSPPTSPFAAASPVLRAPTPLPMELEVKAEGGAEPPLLGVATPEPVELWRDGLAPWLQVGLGRLSSSLAKPAASGGGGGAAQPLLAACVGALKSLVVERRSSASAEVPVPAAEAAPRASSTVLKREPTEQKRDLTAWALMLPAVFLPMGGAPEFDLSRRPAPCRTGERPLLLQPPRGWQGAAVAVAPRLMGRRLGLSLLLRRLLLR